MTKQENEKLRRQYEVNTDVEYLALDLKVLLVRAVQILQWLISCCSIKITYIDC